MSARAFAVVGLVVLAACGKTSRATDPGAGGSALDSTRAPDGGAYGPASLRMQACPAEGTVQSPGIPERGCEKCGPGEHCKVQNIHGMNIGHCQKSTCQKDADCKGALCSCGPPNECMPGNCRGPEDCGGRECAPDRWRYGHGTGSFCRTKDDTCTTHDQCGKGKECAYVGGKWACRTEVPAPPPG